MARTEPTKKYKRRRNLFGKSLSPVVGVGILLVLVVGALASVVLVKRNQEMRKSASETTNFGCKYIYNKKTDERIDVPEGETIWGECGGSYGQDGLCFAPGAIMSPEADRTITCKDTEKARITRVVDQQTNIPRYRVACVEHPDCTGGGTGGGGNNVETCHVTAGNENYDIRVGKSAFGECGGYYVNQAGKTVNKTCEDKEAPKYTCSKSGDSLVVSTECVTHKDCVTKPVSPDACIIYFGDYKLELKDKETVWGSCGGTKLNTAGNKTKATCPAGMRAKYVCEKVDGKYQVTTECMTSSCTTN